MYTIYRYVCVEYAHDTNRACGENELWCGEQPTVYCTCKYEDIIFSFCMTIQSTQRKTLMMYLCGHNYGFVYFANPSVITFSYMLLLIMKNIIVRYIQKIPRQYAL